jgi:phage major head subunit gpT-like protein
MEAIASNLEIIFRTASLQYQSALNSTPSWHTQIASVMTSASRQVVYAWMDRIPILREWLGERVVNAAATHSRTVTNKPFELTLDLDKFDIEDDQLGLFAFGVMSMGQQASKWPDQQIARWMRSEASTVNGFDGVPQFSTAHPILGGDVVGSAAGGFGGVTGIPATQSNLALSTALTYDNYGTARAAMQSFRGADGQPLGVNPTLLVVPPQLEPTAKMIVENDYVPSTTGTGSSTAPGQAPMNNVFKGTTKVMVIPELADKPTNWWLLDTSKVVKPFLWQLRTAPVFTPRTSPTDPIVFDTHKYRYGIEARGVAAETLWFLSYAGTSAASY